MQIECVLRLWRGSGFADDAETSFILSTFERRVLNASHGISYHIEFRALKIINLEHTSLVCH